MYLWNQGSQFGNLSIAITAKDDGRGMIACEKCEIWQHIECAQEHFNWVENLEKAPFICEKCVEGSNVNVTGEDSEYSSSESTVSDWKPAENFPNVKKIKLVVHSPRKRPDSDGLFAIIC